MIGFFDGFLHLFERLFLFFNRFFKIFLGFFRSGFLVLSLSQFFLNLWHVFLTQFLHVLKGVGHLLHGLLIELAVTSGILKNLFHFLGDFLHFLSVLSLLLLAFRKLFFGFFALKFFGSIVLIEAFVLVEVV